MLRRQDGIRSNNNDQESSGSSNSGLQQATEEVQLFPNFEEDIVDVNDLDEGVPEELNIDQDFEVGAEEFALQNQQ